jgi:3-oxoacyl-[acyl-carrier-protein] synthase II
MVAERRQGRERFPRVVVTGLGSLTPLGESVSALWSRLVAGESGIGPITAFDAAAFKVRFAGEVRGFDPEIRFGPKAARRLDRFAQFALAGALEAVKDAGLDFSRETPSRCGVILGTGIGGMRVCEDECGCYHQLGPTRTSPLLVPRMMPNAAAAAVSIHFGLGGPCYTVSSACASASDAIAGAADLIRSGRADVVVSGGAEAALTPVGLAGFCATRSLSERNEAPQRASRPFDRDRDGFVLGEGAGIIVLENLVHAHRRGANVYCELLGCGQSADAHHITAPHPDGIGAATAMRLALEDAGVTPDGIDYLNAHATGTNLGDAAEVRAIRSAFGSHADRMPVSSTKSMIGHLCGASGGVAAVVAALTIRDGVVHPTINYETPDPACNLDCVPNSAREIRVRRAAVNNFGFGGHNCCLVFGAVNEYEGVTVTSTPGPVY